MSLQIDDFGKADPFLLGAKPADPHASAARSVRPEVRPAEGDSRLAQGVLMRPAISCYPHRPIQRSRLSCLISPRKAASASLRRRPAQDTFVLNRFEATEGLGSCSNIASARFRCRRTSISTRMIGRNCNVRIKAVDGLDRHFNGVLTEANYTGGQYGLFGYQLVLRPWLHLLSRTSDCRIFSNMKPNKIITQVFSDRGFNDFRENLQEDYPTLEYTVQYRETDLNFVCRLMEKYGIYYYFEHTQSKHTLVLCDAPELSRQDPWAATGAAAARDHGGPARPAAVRFLVERTRAADGQGRAQRLFLREAGPGSARQGRQAWLLRAFDAGDLRLSRRLRQQVRRREMGQGARRSRAGAGRSPHRHRQAPSLFPGGKFSHENNPAQGDNKEYLVLRCTHSYVDQTYISGGGAPVAYAGTYELMDSSRQFRSLLTTRRSVVVGWQSALVVGKAGRGDRRRQGGPHPRAVLLGSQEGQFAANARRAVLGRQDARRLVLPAHRRRGAGCITRTATPIGRSSSAPSTTARTPCRPRCPTRRPIPASSPNRARTATATTC